MMEYKVTSVGEASGSDNGGMFKGGLSRSEDMLSATGIDA